MMLITKNDIRTGAIPEIFIFCFITKCFIKFIIISFYNI
jgi:hypothetical protein